MIGPVESTIFTNQQMASVASDKNAQLNRIDLQNQAAAEIANDKEKEVQEVRPTEENHAVDEDREHQKQEAESESQKERHKDTSEHEDDQNASTTPLSHLDIKV